MELNRYGVNVKETALQPREKQRKYKSRGLHKALIKGGIPVLVKSSKSSCMRKIILLLTAYIIYIVYIVNSA